MTVAAAFVLRDARIWLSYRMALVWQAVGIAVILLLTYFVGRAVGMGGTGLQGPAGSESYSAFVLAGVAFTDTFTVGLTGIPQALREAQLSGTLEPLLLTPVPAGWLIAGPVVFRFLQSLLRLFALLAVAIVILGYWHQVDLMSLLVVLASGSLVFIALGLLSSGFVLVFKQGDPVILGYLAVSGILGGTLFPTRLLPAWLKPVVDFLPLSHALTGVRRALNGGGIGDVAPELVVLVGLAAVLLPASILAFNLALSWAKQEGSLAQY